MSALVRRKCPTCPTMIVTRQKGQRLCLECARAIRRKREREITITVEKGWKVNVQYD